MESDDERNNEALGSQFLGDMHQGNEMVVTQSPEMIDTPIV